MTVIARENKKTKRVEYLKLSANAEVHGWTKIKENAYNWKKIETAFELVIEMRTDKIFDHRYDYLLLLIPE